MRLLGGGSAYEAYLAFDEITYAPGRGQGAAARPGRPTRPACAGLRARSAALAAVNHPVVVRGLRHDVDGERPHLVLEHIDGRGSRRWSGATGRCRSSSTCRWRSTSPPRCTTSRHVGYVHLDIKPSNIIMGSPGPADRPVGDAHRRGGGRAATT